MKRPKKPFLFKRRLVVNPWNQNVGWRLATKGIRTIVVSDFSVHKLLQCILHTFDIARNQKDGFKITGIRLTC